MKEFESDDDAVLNRVNNGRALTSLLLSRVAYAVNWYNVASIFALIAFDFKENVSGLGVLTGSFFLGVAIFQVPGGILAAKFGPRKASIFGTLIASFAALLTAFANQFYQLIALRFVVGVGLALVFAPEVALIARYFRNQAEGLSVGLLQAGYYVGGAFGLFGWAVLAEFIGWRPSLVVSGVLGVITALSLIFTVPRDPAEEKFLMKRSDMLRVLKDKWLLILSLELFAVTGGTTLFSTFIVFYLEKALKTPVALAGIVGGIAMFSAIPAAPIFGRIYDRDKNTRKLLFLSGIGLSLGIVIVSIQTLYAAVISAILVGIFQGASFTVGFAAARAVQLPDPRYEALAVSWVNGISLLPGFWSPIVFSFLVIRFGYALAWLLGGLYTFILISIILVSKGEHH